MFSSAYTCIVLLCFTTAINSLSRFGDEPRSGPQRKRGILLTVPRVVQPGTTEKACLTLHEFPSDSNLQLQLFIVQNENTLTTSEHNFRHGNGRCFDVGIPSTLEGSELTLVARATAAADARQQPYIFQSNTTLGVKRQSLITFIQTDKPIYKPGQTVRLRVLNMESDLRPRGGNISQVWIENPSGVRMAQWLNIETEKGLASLRMELSEEPTLGEWKIIVNMANNRREQKFKVDEYVLPKYEVTIEMPKYVLIDAKEVEGTICARYTYGKPVKGLMNATVCVQQEYYYRRNRRRNCFIASQPIDGCAQIKINTDIMDLRSSSYSLMGAKLNVSALVVENATGILQNASVAHTSLEQNVMKIDIGSKSPNYFKPGLPYYGKVTVKNPDESPAPNEQVEITVSNYHSNYRVAKNYTSDVNGEIAFTLPAVDTAVSDYSINAKLPRYQYKYEPGLLAMYAPQAYYSVKQWYSPSGSFLQIEPIYESVRCGSGVDLNISYTTDDNTNFKFHYQVLSRGNILHSGSRRRHFRSSRDEQERKNDWTSQTRIARGSGKKKTRRGQKDQDSIELPDHVGRFVLNVPISHEMSPLAKILVFLIREDGETVADSVHVPVQQCLENKVSVSFDKREKRPGQPTVLRIESDPQSLCAVGVVDKSVHILGGNNQLTLAKVYNQLQKFEIEKEQQFPWRSEDQYCNKQVKEKTKIRREDIFPAPPAPPAPPVMLPRGKRSIMWPGMYYSKYFDSMKAFKSASVRTLTDLVIESRPCERQRLAKYGSMPGARRRMSPLQGLPGAAGPVGESAVLDTNNEISDEPVEEETPDIRNYFPETWLWELYHSGDAGSVEVRQDLPHSITEWTASAVCANENSGLGVSEAATIKAFQPFFASFTLPYSIIRGETVPVKVTVFNYMKECIVVRLQLDSSSSFRALNGGPQDLCVCADESQTQSFHITALELGGVNITVRAESVGDSAVCGNKIMARTHGVRDAVTRELLVEPEGVEEEYTFNNFICPSEGDVSAVSARLDLPTNVVEGSSRAQVTAIGDVMGPSLSGLDKLLKLPTGCGEQNMIGFTPNIYVLQYLSSTNQLSPEVEAKAKANMKTGYQRELTYRHGDGSYSAFGERDDSGSMWLTAFVIKSFAQAKPYIFIDEADLQKSIDWFKTKQLENGCFPQVGRVLHKGMKGGLENGGTAALTSYVLAAMLEAGVSKDEPVVQDALLCLDVQEVDDVYTLAQMAYTYTLYDHTGSRRRDVMRKLSLKSVVQGGTLHWENVAPTQAPSVGGWVFKPYHQAASADVETTAYALMAHVLNADKNSAIAEGLSIVRWLTMQRNAYGGFSSTQDTIVALQALADYASLVYGSGTDMDIQINGRRYGKTFRVTDENSLLLQRDSVPLPNDLEISASGAGCALVQANVKYNVPTNSTATEAFDLRSTLLPVNGNCMKRTINICVRYTGADSVSNMAVVSVKMVTGWLPQKRSIQDLQQDTSLMLKRFDVDKNWVHLYFDEFSTSQRCFSFQVEQDLEVNNAKPGIVHVYDYYDTDKSAQAEYSIRTTCGTKEELPHITREEYNRLTQNETFIGQVRVPPEPFPGRVRQPQPISDSSCPVCHSSNPEGRNLTRLFCGAQHVFKVIPRRSKLKLLYDVRPAEKRTDYQYNVRYKLPDQCTCDLLEGKDKLLLFTNEGPITKHGRKMKRILGMSSSVEIMLTDRRTERAIKKLKAGRSYTSCE